MTSSATPGTFEVTNSSESQASITAGDLTLDPEFAIVGRLVHPDGRPAKASVGCTASGDILVTAAGHYSRVQVMEGEGVTFDADLAVTPEMVGERYGDIVDMSGPKPHDSALVSFKSLFVKVAPEELAGVVR